jgi:hypothetical protein
MGAAQRLNFFDYLAGFDRFSPVVMEQLQRGDLAPLLGGEGLSLP